MKGIKTELMTHFPLFFGKRKKKSYICSVHFEKSKTKADNNRKVPGIWSQKKDR